VLDDGWFRSAREGRPVDAAGQPIPWLPYPAIDFLASRVKPDFAVFEWGCGTSTLWWAKRVARVVAVEHDEEWFARISDLAPPNAEVRHVAMGSERYANAIDVYAPQFDVVVVDGRERVACLRRAVEGLSPRGVIVLDNSQRPEYAEGIAHLAALGFRHVTFAGLVPVVAWKEQTSIFYRAGNGLEL